MWCGFVFPHGFCKVGRRFGNHSWLAQRRSARVNYHGAERCNLLVHMTGEDRTKVKVLVVGAGLAGVTAANELHADGYDVTIIEASERFGGRIWTERDASGRAVELGATWLHGKTGNPLFECAEKLGILPPADERDPEDEDRNDDDDYWGLLKYVRSDGTLLQPDDVRRVMKLFRSFLNELKDDRAKSSLPSSVGQYLDQRWQETASSIGPHDELIFQARKELECGISGCNDLNEVSARHFDGYDELDGKNTPAPGGMEKLVSPTCPILYETEVVKIQWGTSGVNVLTRGNGSYASDYVIVTVPLGFLKQTVRSFFDPPVAEAKAKAIESAGFGVVDKVILQVDYDFGYTSPVIACDCSAPTWMQNSFLYSGGTYRDTVEFWVKGCRALEMESLEDNVVVEDLLEVLRTSGITSGVKPAPKKLWRSRWGTNPLFGGSYSFPGVNSDEQTFSTIQDPLRDVDMRCRVFFAGEATHPSLYSTMTAAYLSGMRAAGELRSTVDHVN
uniref:Amine oxidase domain-containing protein n=1 Tax=Rhodosorus marinus TaxID=101924 RepID=A0A7S3EL40_9RHOD|mmetsp:Transcript_41440/g.163164  ORF Transcript_41440/g.163164 Transcript_41440/m.163164 type:complete len:503 (+) Transcript_41440:521-2029(+)